MELSDLSEQEQAELIAKHYNFVRKEAAAISAALAQANRKGGV